jgi:hypothetical protein
VSSHPRCLHAVPPTRKQWTVGFIQFSVGSVQSNRGTPRSPSCR